MSSTNNTNFLGLSQWIKSDIPTMEDFNSDNETIDSILGEHIRDVDSHLEPNQVEKIAKPFAKFIYYGDGAEKRSINLGFDFDPKICFLITIGAPIGVIDIPNDTHYNYFGIVTPEGSTDGLSLSGKTLSVIQGGPMVARYEMRNYNEKGRSYMVIGFR